MDKYKLLSGTEIITKGITKINTSLPEVGIKDVLPNGSWLEQKQIQAALEARKHLIEVERIEKCGTLSHAEWRENLNLAEVTQKSGGHWQYLGHNKNKKLYLKPEEALVLMELNCLLLKHNGFTVSLQKAYSLLLKDTESLLKYRVYSSLSRLGYKVFRHTPVKNKKNDAENHKNGATSLIETITSDEEKVETDPNETEEMHKQNKEVTDATESNLNIGEIIANIVANIMVTSQESETEGQTNDDKEETESIEVITEMDSHSDANFNENEGESQELNWEMNVDTDARDLETLEDQQHTESNVLENINNDQSKKVYNAPYMITLNKLRNRNLKPTDSHILHKNFNSIPDLFQKQMAIINVPSEDFLPKNVFVNKSCYVLNLSAIKSKTVRSTSRASSYSLNDEVNEAHVRQIRSAASVERPQNVPSQNFPAQSFNYPWARPNPWGPPNNNFDQFGMYYPRPYMPNMYFMPPQFQYYQRPFMRPFFNATKRGRITPNPRKKKKRKKGALKKSQLNDIKALAAKIKVLMRSGNSQTQNINSLNSLLHTFNMRYQTKLRLDEHFDIVSDERVSATIELGAVEPPAPKKPRLSVDDKYTENINKLKQVAKKLKDLESNNKANARHRRAFSNAVKTFNKSYRSDVHFNSNYDVVDRSYINLDSSSESDCVIEESSATKDDSTAKKLKNPFHVLKRLSEKSNVDNIASCSKDDVMEVDRTEMEQDTSYSELLKREFNDNWLPNEKDFGRAEVVSKIRKADGCKIEHLLSFIKDQPERYDDWLELKVAFYKFLVDAAIAFSEEQKQLRDAAEQINSGIKPLLSDNVGLDDPAVLEKLRIIPNNKECCSESVLKIDFDVYNRDVQNFRKTNPPKPHFRVICISETASFPSASEVSALYADYDDSIPIVFSIVGISSISYLRINPIDLPVYISNTDTV